MILGRQIFISCLWMVLGIAWTLSFVCLIVHFYKFFRSPFAQSLATKHLTVYCFILFLIYIVISYERRPELKFAAPKHKDPSFRNSYAYVTVIQYLLLTSTFYKFIIALDLCWTFRKIALYLQPPSGPQNKTLLVYCLSGFGIPLIYIGIRLMYFYDQRDKDLECMATHYELDIIRILRLIPIFGAFWYIRSASMNKTEWWSNFSLHVRLLITLGGFSALLSVAQLLTYVLIPNDESDTESAVLRIYYRVQMVGMILEGFVMAIFFTFKKDTFQHISNLSN